MEERLLALLKLAIKHNATDIHFDYAKPDMKIEMRINGLCKKVKSRFDDYKLIRYIQYLANLDVGNLSKPQTGQFELIVDGNLLSLRFAVMNSFGRVIGVLRILNPNLNISSSNLSLNKNQNLYFQSLLNKRSGLVLFSGATGSGKTTTLYTLLKDVKEKKIYSIEDPIEVYIENMAQLQINEARGINYGTGIAQILRHDPDIIMIGEIRDEVAAKHAVIAANTGHLVFSTIHSSSASSVISRLIELGVNKDHLYENLLCISCQEMLIGKNKEKIILYEVMDKKEIEYFKNNNKHSASFINLDVQEERGRKNGLFS